MRMHCNILCQISRSDIGKYQKWQKESKEVSIHLTRDEVSLPTENTLNLRCNKANWTIPNWRVLEIVPTISSCERLHCSRKPFLRAHRTHGTSMGFTELPLLTRPLRCLQFSGTDSTDSNITLSMKRTLWVRADGDGEGSRQYRMFGFLETGVWMLNM